MANIEAVMVSSVNPYSYTIKKYRTISFVCKIYHITETSVKYPSTVTRYDFQHLHEVSRPKASLIMKLPVKLL